MTVKDKKKLRFALSTVELALSIACLVLTCSISKTQREEQDLYEGKHIAH